MFATISMVLWTAKRLCRIALGFAANDSGLGIGATSFAFSHPWQKTKWTHIGIYIHSNTCKCTCYTRTHSHQHIWWNKKEVRSEALCVGGMGVGRVAMNVDQTKAHVTSFSVMLPCPYVWLNVCVSVPVYGRVYALCNEWMPAKAPGATSRSSVYTHRSIGKWERTRAPFP